MATLTAAEKDELRQRLARVTDGKVSWTRPQINAVFQAIEDWWERPATQAAVAAAIDAAVPGLGAGQKKAVVAVWSRQKSRRDGGG